MYTDNKNIKCVRVLCIKFEIAECCEKELRYTAGYDMPRFVADTLVYDAVARNLEIIGEAIE